MYLCISNLPFLDVFWLGYEIEVVSCIICSLFDAYEMYKYGHTYVYVSLIWARMADNL